MPSLSWQEVLSALPYADYLVLINEIIEELKNKFRKLKDIENKGLKVNCVKTYVMVSGGNTKDGLQNENFIHVGLAA